MSDPDGPNGASSLGRPRGTGRPPPMIVRILPVIMLVAGVLLESLTPASVTASPFFSAAPLLAAPFTSARNTAVVALLSLAAVVGIDTAIESVSVVVTVAEAATVATVSVLALFINWVVRRSGQRLASARIIAETAQRAVLPTPAEEIGGLRVAARYEAALRDTFIGGDLFVVLDTPFGVRLVVGDVRGKGLEAVAIVAVAVGAFREAAEQERSLEGVAQRLERAIMREKALRGELDAFEGFTTAVLAEIPYGENVVRLVNRGHPAPLLLFADGSLRSLEPDEYALPLGMGDLGSLPDRADQIEYPDGATLLLYTDGLSEARNEEGVFFDTGARLLGRTFKGPEALLDELVGEVVDYTGGGSKDDMALLAVCRPTGEQLEEWPERRGAMPLTP
ncbi:PP2C family protein-serine/threonine phosphatase [Streptomyces sp. NPDC088725]|uniref:PP2C family protein-serine/threonine phosphatase n=1 Tax=Streptomyces sp. NPDC088725 TaxID=3365873 RepID=UPI00383020C0